RPHYLASVNLDLLVRATGDTTLRRTLFDAHLLLAEGAPLRWMLKNPSSTLTARIAGAELAPLTLDLAEERGFRVFILGATDELAQRAARNLRRSHPQLHIAGIHSAPIPLSQAGYEEIRRCVQEANPTILLAAFTSPVQEKWLGLHYRAL